MCLNPIHIRTPARSFTPQGGQLLKMNVRCNYCAECVESIRQEWTFRTYYQMRDCYNHGGYIYYVSPTYAPKHLPMLSHFCDIEKYGLHDFSVFNHRDFKNFLKLLRIRLKRLYGVDSNAFKYFLTSEYGTEDGRTHRPHYHIMFFVYCTIIDPLRFADLVDECWTFGRTDGPRYKPTTYVLNHIYTSKTDFDIVSKASMYVSKYITKSSKFQQVLDRRINMLRLHNVPQDELKELIRNISMFHRQSQGYGLSYLSVHDSRKDMYLNEDKCFISDTDDVVKVQPLPMYYKRHLYYNLKKRSDDTYYWELNDIGKVHFSNIRIKRVDDEVQRFQTIIDNNPTKYNEIISHLLGSRSLQDLAIYSVFYRHRSIPHNLVHTKFEDNYISVYDMDNLITNTYDVNSNSTSFHSYDEDDKKFLRVPFRSGKYYKIYKNITTKDYIDNYHINESFASRFRHFDRILDLFRYCDLNSIHKFRKQDTFNYLEDLREKLKQINQSTN